MKCSKDYHDYVFKDGRLIGKFDEMYKYSSETPWHQDKTACSVFSDIDIAILKQHKYASICEIGCGLGYFSSRLYKEVNSEGEGRPKVTGIDISDVAVEKAKKLFPEICFIAGDLLKEKHLTKETFDLVVVKETLWYVCHELKNFMENVLSMTKKNGFLYVSQSFPESDNYVGKDVLDSPERLKKLLSHYAAPLHYCVEYDWNYKGRPLVHFLGRKP